MAGVDQKRRSSYGHESHLAPRPSLSQRTGSVSPTQRSSSRRRSVNPPEPTLRRITLHNPPQINSQLARSQLSATMTSPPQSPTKSIDTGSSLVNPTSTILQGLIQEQRSRGSRQTVSDSTEEMLSNHTPPTSQSRSQDDSQSEKQRIIANALAAGLKEPHEMGIREQAQVSSLLFNHCLVGCANPL